MKSQALILCNGEPPSRRLAKQALRNSDYFVAADGGANGARKLGLRPDLIIGDLDSISASTSKYFSGKSTILRVARQDNTDLEKALDHILTLRIPRVVILGATGARIDFTLGNFSVLWKYASKVAITVRGNDWWAAPIRKQIKVKAKKGARVSLIPYSRCSGITLRGLKYPLTNARMKIGEVGVSNQVTSSPFSVSVKRGHLLLIVFTQ